MKMTKLLSAVLVLAGMTTLASAQSSTYYFKHLVHTGTVSNWYDNDNSWGYHNTSGSGFTEMVMGEDWGTISPYHPIPAKISTVSTSATSWFWEQHVVNSGGYIDAVFDDFCDSAIVTNRQGSEIMIWANYTNTQPLADNYDGSGKAVAIKTNVAIDGRYWDIYQKKWSSGYYTLSFIDRSPQGGESVHTAVFFNWGVNNKPAGSSSSYWPSSWYLMEIGGGWEFSNGWASATSYGNSGF